MLSKSRVYNYHQIIEVKNTKSDSIIVTVTDQLPRSCNDKIKVGLLYPILSLHKKFLQIIVHKIIVFRNVHWVYGRMFATVFTYTEFNPIMHNAPKWSDVDFALKG